MVTIQPATNETNDKGVVYSWTSANQGDVGAPVSVLSFGEMTHASIGSSFTTITWQGSVDGGTTWATIGAGHTDSVTGVSTRMAEHPYLVRPVFTTIAASVTAYLTAARQYY
jgi:hypothetical protein